MAKRDVIVIGASAGGVVALCDIVKTLPEDCDVFIFVVLHVAPHTASLLPQILTNVGPLEAVHATDGETIQKRKIYIAPPDHHMLLDGTKIVVKRGPKENRFRPSIDALFRSAAYVFGPRVIGVILTGMLDDGTSGLWSVKRLGGISIIQNPEEAHYPDMPLNVLTHVEVDHVVPAIQIGPLFCRLSKEATSKRPKLTLAEKKLMEMEVIISIRDNAFEMGIMKMGELTPFTCPECHGALIQLKSGTIMRYRCHTGHAFTASTLLAGVSETVEQTLWQAMRALEENSMLLDTIGEQFKDLGNLTASKLFHNKAKDIADRARIIHSTILGQEQLSEDIRHNEEPLKKKKPKK